MELPERVGICHWPGSRPPVDPVCDRRIEPGVRGHIRLTHPFGCEPCQPRLRPAHWSGPCVPQSPAGPAPAAPSAPSLGGGGPSGSPGISSPNSPLSSSGGGTSSAGSPVGSVRPRWHAGCGCGEGRRRWSAHWPPTADHAFAAAACQHPAGCAAYCSHAASRSGASPRRACATAQRSLRRTCRARRSSATLGRRCPRRRRSACSGHATRTAAHTSTRSTSCGSRRDGPGGHIDRTRRRPRRRGRCNKRCGSACASTGFGRTRRARRNCRRRDRRCTAPAVRRRQ